MTSFQDLLEGDVIAEEIDPDARLDPLLPDEQALVERAVDKRIREFRAGRHCAHRALARLGIEAPFRLMTLHRAENTDDRNRLEAIFAALGSESSMRFVLPLHPRTRKYLADFGIRIPANLRLIEPVGYFDMLELEEACEGIVTDSGGVQKEAYFFGKPCVTLRDQTEWVETVEAGWNRTVGANAAAIAGALAAQPPSGARPELYGKGDAGRRILEALVG